MEACSKFLWLGRPTFTLDFELVSDLQMIRNFFLSKILGWSSSEKFSPCLRLGLVLSANAPHKWNVKQKCWSSRSRIYADRSARRVTSRTASPHTDHHHHHHCQLQITNYPTLHKSGNVIIKGRIENKSVVWILCLHPPFQHVFSLLNTCCFLTISEVWVR